MVRTTPKLFIALLCLSLAACDSEEDAPAEPADPLALQMRSETANGALPAFRISVPAGIADAAKRTSSNFSSEIEWKTKDRKLPELTVKAFPPSKGRTPSFTLPMETGMCAKSKGKILSDTRVGKRRKVVCQATITERGGVRKDVTRVMVSWMEGKNFMHCRASQRGKAKQAYLESLCDSLELES